MQLISRDHDVVTNAKDIEPLFETPYMPIFMGISDKPVSEDIMAKMSWGISRSSGCVQLQKLVPPSILYSESHNSGGIGGIWSRHHREFAEFVKQFSPQSVLEIGGGHGLLSREYMDLQSADWTILEPHPSPAQNVNAKYIKGFIDDEFRPEKIYDAIIHSHVLEHMHEPRKFLNNIHDFMPDNSLHIFSIPNLREWLKLGFTNTLNFEHTYLLSEEIVEYMLYKSGYIMLDKYYFNNTHSIFYAFRHQTSDIRHQTSDIRHQTSEYQRIHMM